MSIRVAIEHRTAYRFDRDVELLPHVIRLRPAPHCRTPILAYSLTVTPAAHFLNWQQDPAGNHIARVVFTKPARELSITVDLIAEMTPLNPFDFFVQEDSDRWPLAYDPALAGDLAPYLATEPAGALLTRWLQAVPQNDAQIIDFLVDINRRVLADVSYSVRLDPGVHTPDETLSAGVASCRDSAWLLVQALRNLGVAARFVSGYLVQLRPDDSSVGPTHDFTDLHAWAEAYVPGAGWIGLDPTSGLLTSEGHIPLACTSAPAAAAPIEGGTGIAQVEFEFENVVRRVHEPPRVTKPYTAAQWRAIDALGNAVDADLERGDVRLTMGGEPTFVSTTDMESPEWTIAALGGEKHALALALVDRLKPDGSLLLHGQGKWYPGEPLPRWLISAHWRTDGHPLWRDPRLLADPSTPGIASPRDAHALASAIGAALGLAPEAWYPAYEDPVERLLQEARLPGGDPPELEAPDPSDGDVLDNGRARAQLIADLDSERGDPAGWVLPLHRSPGDAEWSTGSWTLRRGHLLLVPGDSPIGLRLPLPSLTWTPPEPEEEQSLFRVTSPLAVDPHAARAAATPADPPPVTALCVELRDEHVHVFLPPLKELEHAAELLATIEAAAAASGVEVVLEGYPPPRDNRVSSFGVAPDPGVLEVNIHPSGSWPELVERNESLIAAAAEIGLGTEKFALDGTHTGTGGGAHLTLGGATPADSPLLRRPDLLRSMLTYWQHHPALSYLFSGRFIGPTSQAPRVDEARHESLYELEIAFAELERAGSKASPWLVDRCLRHLLVDLTGNSHRAEFCIDKLFDPESESGRLGVLELRGFEMPPHPQMLLVQALLVRALVARFWKEPYGGELVRWGAELHDRFMLPWFVEHDLHAVLEDLRRHGYRFDDAWFAPFLEFRFPLLGRLRMADVSLELRAAIEPWHVLGEEVGATATARYVDSSCERLQVLADGLVEGRHVVACNGFAVPLSPTDRAGVSVAGVRYRAWQPPSALHPTIGVHAPLTFDIVDTWSGRSLGGCRYHVTHPGGLAYERFPVNAAEGQARRVSRFEPSGHSSGRIEVQELRRGSEYARTLDLRRT